MKTMRLKKLSRKVLIKRLDQIVSLIVRLRDGASVLSGSTENLTCGHLITRSKYSVRWDLKNCHAQTAGENFEHEHNPHKYINWFINKFGLEDYQDLVRRSNIVNPKSNQELRELLEQLTIYYQQLINKGE